MLRAQMTAGERACATSSSAIWGWRIHDWAATEVSSLIGSGQRRATSWTTSTATSPGLRPAAPPQRAEALGEPRSQSRGAGGEAFVVEHVEHRQGGSAGEWIGEEGRGVERLARRPPDLEKLAAAEHRGDRQPAAQRLAAAEEVG